MDKSLGILPISNQSYLLAYMYLRNAGTYLSGIFVISFTMVMKKILLSVTQRYNNSF